MDARKLAFPDESFDKIYSFHVIEHILNLRDAFAEMDRLAGEVPPGSDGLIFHPYLQGERAPYWDPLLRADFIGMTMQHGRAHFARALYEAVCPSDARESAQVQKMKKYMNYLGVGAEPTGQFLHQIRRVTTKADFLHVCEEFLSHDQPMPLEPFSLALKETDVMAGSND